MEKVKSTLEGMHPEHDISILPCSTVKNRNITLRCEYLDWELIGIQTGDNYCEMASVPLLAGSVVHGFKIHVFSS